MQSETVGKLAKALAKAQLEIGAVTKDAKNPFYNSNYASLGAVMDVCRGPLNNNGFAVVQGCENDAGGRVVVTTTFLHESGEWIKSSISMNPKKDDPQQSGSCISYGRRYLLAAMAGVYQADDDGNAASGKDKPCEKPQKKSGSQKPQTPPSTVASSDPKPLSQASALAGDMAAAIKSARAAAIKYGCKTTEECYGLVSAYIQREVTDWNQCSMAELATVEAKFKEAKNG